MFLIVYQFKTQEGHTMRNVRQIYSVQPKTSTQNVLALLKSASVLLTTFIMEAYVPPLVRNKFFLTCRKDFPA